ncbi:MAG: tyrosine--tRNA ligase [Cyanobacteria bacterium]|nr:tyrosine--tRNA ligase [Cyanobacteriota bacterium]
MEQALSLSAGGEILPSVELLAQKLSNAAKTRTPLRVKLGLDPTRPDLHLGHSVVLKKLRAFQDLGHQAVLIIGDATAMIGDPSGRTQTRPPLTDTEVQQNAETYLAQAGHVIDVKKAEIVRNSQWFNQMNLGDFLKLAARVTAAQILTREDFATRMQESKPIYMHELFYPLMQGYDSVMVDADIELGGTDQRFNNLMGRELQNAYEREKQQLVLLMPLLEGTDGKVKMSKSYPEHCINLTDTPEDMFGKVMSIPDTLLDRYHQLLTPLTEEQREQQQALMLLPPEEGGINPRDVKAYLAKWIITQYHGQEVADTAEAAFIKQFRNKELPEEIEQLTLKANQSYLICDLMVQQGMAPSKSEARRLVTGGGVRLNQEKIENPDALLQQEAGSDCILQVGKRRFLRLVFEN